MKKSLGVLFVLWLAMVFVCSCQNGVGTDDTAGSVAVYKVNLSVELPADGPQRTISVSGGSNLAGYTYLYEARPQWDDSENAAFGKTNGFVNIENYAAGKDLGYFQQGQWTFNVAVKSGEIVVYEGSETVYINAANTTVEVDVTRGAEKGKIAFGEITAARVNPTLASNKVLMEYGLFGSSSVIAEQEVTCASDSQNLSFVIAPVNNLAAGNYWVKLTYLNDPSPDNSTLDDASEVGSAIVNFTLDAGQTATVSGNLEEGVFQTALITLNGISSLSLTDITSSVTSGVVTFTCTATPADGAEYQWYINGKKVNGATSSSYAWSPDAKQNASITCTATRGHIVASKVITYQVTVLP